MKEMKKVIIGIIAVVGLTLASCGNRTPVAPPEEDTLAIRIQIYPDSTKIEATEITFDTIVK